MNENIQLDELRRFEEDVLLRSRVSRDDSATVIEALVYADSRGIATHGLAVLVNEYAPRLQDGRIVPDAQCQIVERRPGIAVVDAGNGLGPVASTYGMDMACELAMSQGVGAVGIRNSTHFGAAGYYTHRAAMKGLIGISMTNCGAQGFVPPVGGRLRMLGTNPLSVGAPTGGLPPFVLDMSTSVVATGRIKAAASAGTGVPEGWLIDGDGCYTRDPEEYLAGRAHVAWLGGMLETGAAKGYGLAVVVDLLCGALTGSRFGPTLDRLANPGRPTDDRGIGHFFLAIDPHLGTTSDYSACAEELLSAVLGCPPIDPNMPVTYAGYREHVSAEAAASRGVQLPRALRLGADELAATLSVLPLAASEVSPR